MSPLTLATSTPPLRLASVLLYRGLEEGGREEEGRRGSVSGAAGRKGEVGEVTRARGRRRERHLLSYKRGGWECTRVDLEMSGGEEGGFFWAQPGSYQ